MGMGKQWKIQVSYILFSWQVSIRQYFAFNDLQNVNYFKLYLFLRSYFIDLPNLNKTRIIASEHIHHRNFLQGIKFSFFSFQSKILFYFRSSSRFIVHFQLQKYITAKKVHGKSTVCALYNTPLRNGNAVVIDMLSSYVLWYKIYALFPNYEYRSL